MAHGPPGAGRDELSSAHGPGAGALSSGRGARSTAHEAGALSSGPRPTARERRPTAHGSRAAGSGPRPYLSSITDQGPRGPVSGGRAKRENRVRPQFITGRNNVQRAPGPVYTHEKKARRSGPESKADRIMRAQFSGRRAGPVIKHNRDIPRYRTI